MAFTTTTELTNAIPAIIRPQVIQSANDARVFRPIISEFPFTGPGDTLDLLKIGALSASAFTEGGSQARTFTTDTPAKVTLTPSEVDVAVAFTDKAMRRNIFSLLPVYSVELGRAVAVKMDADVAAEYANFTGTAVDEGDMAASLANLLKAMGNVRAAAKDQLGGIVAVMHTSAWDDLITDTNVISASVRGGPTITGQLDVLGGGRIFFTTAIVSAGSPAKYQNMVFHQRTLALAWKQDVEIEAWRDADTKTTKIAAGADYDVATWNAAEGVVYTVNVT